LPAVSLTTYYRPSSGARTFRFCNDLSLSALGSQEVRLAARRALLEYAQPLSALVPGMRSVQLRPPLEMGWYSFNPSVVTWRGKLHVIVRAIDYLPFQNGLRFCVKSPHINRNYFGTLDEGIALVEWKEILEDADGRVPQYGDYLNPEDMRPFVLEDELYCVTSRKDANQRAVHEVFLAKLNTSDPQRCFATNMHRISQPAPEKWEKNWVPQVSAGELRLLRYYKDNVIVSADGAEMSRSPSADCIEHFRGGTQLIPFRGGWLGVCHEVVENGAMSPQYLHRFAWFDEDTLLRRVSEPFTLQGNAIEFIIGLAPHPDNTNLVISYGVGDRESWIALVPAGEVAGWLHLTDGPGVHAQAAHAVFPDSATANLAMVFDRLC
jgi:hypothetical protein